jgi:hypothetical protein
MSSADLDHTNGFGLVLVSAMQARIAASRSPVLVKAPRSRRQRLSSANQHSTRLSQEALVGVRCTDALRQGLAHAAPAQQAPQLRSLGLRQVQGHRLGPTGHGAPPLMGRTTVTPAARNCKRISNSTH